MLKEKLQELPGEMEKLLDKPEELLEELQDKPEELLEELLYQDLKFLEPDL
jgi:hypothetical protein